MTTDGMWKQLAMLPSNRDFSGTVMSYAIRSLDDDRSEDEERMLLIVVTDYLRRHDPRYDDIITIDLDGWVVDVRVDDWPLQCWETPQ
jgi:hypothetical protein